MKKYILSLLCITLAVTGYCSETMSLLSAPPKPVKISLSFYIARPALNCEEGFGICRFSFGIGRVGGDGRQVSAEAWVENGQFTVQILRNYVESSLEEELNRLDYFDIGEDTAIPQFILEKMGLRDSYSIPEGRYRIIKYGEYFEINFDLR